MQTLAFTSFLMNGDAFAAVQFREHPRWPYALRLRLIEADLICSPDRTDRMAPCTIDGHDVFQIVQGVETDRDGAVVAYWIASRHPLAYDSTVPLTWTRVEARDPETGEPNILCVTQRERAGARRSIAGSGVAHAETDGQIHGSRTGGSHRGIVHHAVYQA